MGDGRERAGGRWKDCAGEEEVCEELGGEEEVGRKGEVSEE